MGSKHIMVRGKAGKLFGEGSCVRMVSDTKGGGSEEVYDGIQGCFVVTMIQCPLVGGEERQDGSDIRAGYGGQPVNESADALVDRISFGEVRVVRVRVGYGVDGAQGSVWGHEGHPVAVFEYKLGVGVFGKCLLRDTEREVSIGTAITFKGRSEEEVRITHEVSGDFAVKKLL